MLEKVLRRKIMLNMEKSHIRLRLVKWIESDNLRNITPQSVAATTETVDGSVKYESMVPYITIAKLFYIIISQEST